jgi:hypothetical protein
MVEQSDAFGLFLCSIQPWKEKNFFYRFFLNGRSLLPSPTELASSIYSFQPGRRRQTHASHSCCPLLIHKGRGKSRGAAEMAPSAME